MVSKDFSPGKIFKYNNPDGDIKNGIMFRVVESDAGGNTTIYGEALTSNIFIKKGRRIGCYKKHLTPMGTCLNG